MSYMEKSVGAWLEDFPRTNKTMQISIILLILADYMFCFYNAT